MDSSHPTFLAPSKEAQQKSGTATWLIKAKPKENGKSSVKKRIFKTSH